VALPATAPAQVPTTTTHPPAAPATTVYSEPTATPTPPTTQHVPTTQPMPTMQPFAPPPATGPTFPSAGDPPIVERPVATTALGGEASIVNLIKEHNVPVGDGSFALKLRTTFRVDAAGGGRYRVWITFFDQATGRPLRSTRPAFADGQGNVHVVTRPVDSVGRGQEFDAPLGIPYGVFPDPGVGRVTDVEARVELTRVNGTQEVPVATSSTTFRVHGPEAPATTTSEPLTTFPAPR
jgi:hypothetical protein